MNWRGRRGSFIRLIAVQSQKAGSSYHPTRSALICRRRSNWQPWQQEPRQLRSWMVRHYRAERRFPLGENCRQECQIKKVPLPVSLGTLVPPSVLHTVLYEKSNKMEYRKHVFAVLKLFRRPVLRPSRYSRQGKLTDFWRRKVSWNLILETGHTRPEKKKAAARESCTWDLK